MRRSIAPSFKSDHVQFHQSWNTCSVCMIFGDVKFGKTERGRAGDLDGCIAQLGLYRSDEGTFYHHV